MDPSGLFYINKNMIDGAHKDKKCRKYDKNFSIKVFMNSIDQDRIGNYEMVHKKEFKLKKKAKHDKSVKELKIGEDHNDENYTDELLEVNKDALNQFKDVTPSNADGKEIVNRIKDTDKP